MSELDTTIEELEAEVLAELEEAAHDAPMKGAAPAEKTEKVKGKTPGGEVQDGGEPVVEPDAKKSPTDVTDKSAKEVSGDEQQDDEGKPEPMKHLKKVKEDAHEEEEEMEEMSKKDLMAAMHKKWKVCIRKILWLHMVP